MHCLGLELEMVTRAEWFSSGYSFVPWGGGAVSGKVQRVLVASPGQLRQGMGQGRGV